MTDETTPLLLGGIIHGLHHLVTTDYLLVSMNKKSSSSGDNLTATAEEVTLRVGQHVSFVRSKSTKTSVDGSSRNL
jgi:hypothetical protein